MSRRLVCSYHSAWHHIPDDLNPLHCWMCGHISHYHSIKLTKHGYVMYVNVFIHWPSISSVFLEEFWVCCSVPCHGWCDDAPCLVSVVILLLVYFTFLTNECHPSLVNGRKIMDLLVAGILQGSHQCKISSVTVQISLCFITCRQPSYKMRCHCTCYEQALNTYLEHLKEWIWTKTLTPIVLKFRGMLVVCVMFGICIQPLNHSFRALFQFPEWLT